MAIGIFMWGWMYNGQFGMISGVLQNWGIIDGPIAFLARGSTAFWATIITDVWIGVPLVTLYMLAAMQAGDDATLRAVIAIFEEAGFAVVADGAAAAGGDADRRPRG